MFYIYILYSELHNKTYVGQTADIEKRFIEHNSPDNNGFTKKYQPWLLAHKENFKSRTEAMKRENYLKTGVGRDEVKKFIIVFKEQ